LCTTLIFASKIDGKWKGSVDTDSGIFEFTMTFTTEEDTTTGVFSSEWGDFNLTNIKFSGDEFEYTFEVEGYEIVQKGELINDDEIKITYSDDYGENEITIKRVKEE
jgi:hypothetical protein